MGDFHDQELHNAGSTAPIKPLDTEEFRKQAHLVVDFIADYYSNVETYPVRSQVEPGYLKHRVPDSAPQNPETTEEILRDVRNDIIPGLSHWQSPMYYAYFPCTASIPGFLGEMLSTGFNVAGFNWMASPAATELENIVMDWLGKMLDLPAEFLFSGGGGGVIESTTCEAILCTVVTARDQMLEKIGSEMIGKLTVYGSDQTHSAFLKAAKVAGIPVRNFRAVPTTKECGFRLSAPALRETILADIESGMVPVFVCATIGTTTSAAADGLAPICHVAKEFGIWVHVDAAYAGSACICPEHRHYLDGVENADSFSLNAHKWLLTNLECCCMWVKNPTAMTRSLSTNPEYLRNKTSESKQVVDYKDWQIALSRGFRSLKLWLVIRSYGVVGIRKFIRRHIEMAREFEGMVRQDGRFEVAVPRNFSTVCFCVSPAAVGGGGGREASNAELLERINESGKMFMTHGVIGGVHVMRFMVGGSLTEEKHVRYAWEVVQEHADRLLVAAS